MNLLFCVFKYFPYGGMQRSLLAIAKECQKRGSKIDVCALSWEGDVPAGLNLIRVPTKRWTNHRRAQDFAKFVAIQKTRKQYDLVIGFNKMPGLDVYYAADTCLKEKLSQKSRFYKFLPRYRVYLSFEKAVFDKESCPYIFFLSEQTQASYVQHYQIPKEKFSLLPPGISRDKIPPSNTDQIRQDLRLELKISDDDFILLLVGSGFRTKGLNRAILAFHSLPDELKMRTHFIAIGQDNPKPFLKLAQKLNLSEKVRILPGRCDISRFLLGADLLIHPAYYENTGNVLLEAMISGLPVLATEACGFAHYVSEVNAGKVVPSPFEQETLNQYLVEMLTSPERETWKRNGMQLAYTHDLFSRAEKAADIIESLLR